jgi:hypothetical protein
MEENENNLAEMPELSTPAHSDAPAESERATSADESDSNDDGLQESEPTLEEIEHEGKKYAVPPELKDALLRQADYTRKTQELAQQRQQSEAEFAEQRSRIEAERANIQAAGRLTAIDDRLAQYQGVDWQQLSQTDPVRAQQEFFAFQQLKDARAGLQSQVMQHESQRAMQEAQALQQASEALSREIKGWSPDMAKSLREIAKGLGASDRELDGIKAPWIVRALHAQKVLAEMTKTAQKAPPPPAAAPVKTVTGGTSAKFDPDKASMADYMRHEQRRLAKLRRA